MDDLDDALEDLLADTPKPKPSAGRQSRGGALGGGGGKGKPSVFDDDFYKSLAAGAQSDSDISEADPDQMAKTLNDLDDMDAMLFGPKKAGGPPAGKSDPKNNTIGGYTPSTVTRAAPQASSKTGDSSFGKPTNTDRKSALLNDLFSKDEDDSIPAKPHSASAVNNTRDTDFLGSNDRPMTAPSGGRTRDNASNSLGSTAPAGSVKPKSPGKSNRLLFDDEEIDLTGLLSDDEDDFMKKPKGGAKKATPTNSRPNTGPKEDDDSTGSSSRRLEIDRPPTRSGNREDDTPAKRPPAKSRADISFDDDDVLGGMGLDSPKATPVKTASSDDHRPGGAKSILDDLLGTSDKQKPAEPKSRELDFSKYGGSGSGGGMKKKEVTEEDFSFGGYMPSAVSGGGGGVGSRPSSKRSVRFEDDDDILGDRPRSAPGGRKGPSSLLEDMIEKDDRDWLSMATNTEPSRPKSAGDESSKDKAGAKPQSQEPVDWLGLSRLGSPSQTPRQTEANPDDRKPPVNKPPVEQAEQPKSVLKETPERDEDKDGDDWLGVSTTSSRMRGQRSQMGSANQKDTDNDWLGLSQKSTNKKDNIDDWLGTSQKAEAGSKQEDDWLGTKDAGSKKGDDWLGTKGADVKGGTTDFMGLGDEIDPDSLLPSPSKFGPQSSTKNTDELFSAPTPSRNMSASLPWDAPKSQTTTRRDRTPSPASRPPPSEPQCDDSGGSGLDAILAKKKQTRGQSAPPSREGITSTVTSTPQLPQMPASTGLDSTYMQQQLEMQQAQQKAMLEQQRHAAEMMQKQQQQRMEQMRLQQAEMQKQYQKQQETLQQSMMGDPSMFMPMSGMGGGMMGGFPGFQDDMFSMIRKLEQEKEHLQKILDTTKEQHSEEIQLIRDSHQKRLEMMEESFSKREGRLKEENEVLATQSMDKLRVMERERSELLTSQLRQQQDIEDQRRKDVDNLREQHRHDISELRREQEESINRLRRAKEQEVEAVASTHAHAKALQDVISRVGLSAKDLEDLHNKVDTSHLVSLGEREQAARNMDGQLKALQERLERQQHENEMERARLQGLVTKLETQLTEQTRQLEEEKWSVRQEENKLKSLQKSVEKERRLHLEQIERERMEIQQAKDSLLTEQNSVMSNLHEERRLLSDERSQFSLSMKLRQEQEMRESAKHMKSEVEIDSTVKAINDEKAKLRHLTAELEREQEKIAKERVEIEQEQQRLKIEKQKLEQVALQVKQRSQDIEDMCNLAANAREEGQQKLNMSRQVEAEHEHRAKKIQAELQTLRNKEKQIAQERVNLAREKQALEDARSSILCVSCRTPMRDTNKSNSQAVQLQNGSAPPSRMSQAAQKLYSSLPPDQQSDLFTNISAAIEMDRTVRMWRINAQKDKDYLQEESVFLEAIKHTPYHPN